MWTSWSCFTCSTPIALSSYSPNSKSKRKQQLTNIDTEIAAHKDYIAQLARQGKAENRFETDQRYHEAEVSAVFQAAYSTLTGSYKPYNLTAIRSFPNLYAKEYFRDDDDITHLLVVPGTKLYTLEGLNIERLLLSRLASKNSKCVLCVVSM